MYVLSAAGVELGPGLVLPGREPQAPKPWAGDEDRAKCCLCPAGARLLACQACWCLVGQGTPLAERGARHATAGGTSTSHSSLPGGTTGPSPIHTEALPCASAQP